MTTVDLEFWKDNRGQITHGPTTTLVDRTLDFIRSQLPCWRDDADRPVERAEDNLNLQLCDYLDRSARFSFPEVRFSREEPQTGRRSVDLAAKPVLRAVIRGREYTIYQAFLVIEGKRLPAPSTEREREYVSGGERTTGGIQRFKLGVHGAELHVAALVAYVQNGSPNDWCSTVNGWILDLVGTTSDGCTWEAHEVLNLLEQDDELGIIISRSSHGRTGVPSGTTIDMVHFWIAMKMG